ncbi:MAG: alanine--tRNA ligase [Patescibacteria group bacterium]|nr:alanine--tRNA ligase [Patescibacteria group bacterium]
MTTAEIRAKFLAFFRSKGHAIIPSASLIPENDPTVLFTTAGMQPLVPYLLGEPHPMGKRLADCQKCVRTGDIDEVGDNRHCTFFEMLGNWSLGDYFKKEAIEWSFEFLTDAEKGLGLDPQRLYVTVFEGDTETGLGLDEEAAMYWQKAFATKNIDAKIGERIFAYPKNKNWWGPAGQTGPCGPDTEMFYDTLNMTDRRTHAPGWGEADECHPNCDCGRYVEIWNDVFMEFNKTTDGKFEPLAQKNVDTGMGLERVAMMLQGVSTVFDIDIFQPIIRAIETKTGCRYGESPEIIRSIRIIADHLRTATFIIGDQRGVGPSNKDQGYIVRRLIRRAVMSGRKQLGIQGKFTVAIAEEVIKLYGETYPELAANRERVIRELDAEEEKFTRTLEKGVAEAAKLKTKFADATEISGATAYYLYESFGFPREMTEEEFGKKVNDTEWADEQKKHQEMSRAGAEQKFAGGLADHSEISTKYHTATHLLDAALRQVLGTHVEQRGSNITAERMRFDFSHPAKMTPEEIAAVEKLVNDWIAADYPVRFEMMTVDEAKAAGAIGIFTDKYAGLGNQVKVYLIGDDTRGYISKEICGGPHVEHTGQIGSFKIQKEEASSAGIRRIKAVVS